MKAKKSPTQKSGKNNTKPSHHYSPIEKLLPRLDGLRQTGPDRWQACCPAHEDRNPSLSIRETQDGTVLLTCWAGCGAAEIVSAVGLQLRDLFVWRPQNNPRASRPRDGLTSQKRREYREILKDEAYLVAFAQATLASGGEITPEDAERILLADERVRKLRGVLNV